MIPFLILSQTWLICRINPYGLVTMVTVSLRTYFPRGDSPHSLNPRLLMSRLHGL